MYRAALALGLLVTPAVADEITSSEAIKLQMLGEKAKSDIQKHFESKHLKVTGVEMIWACGFKDVECTASNKFKFTGRAVVVPPSGSTQVADCEATANPEETDVVSSCRLFTQNLKFNKDECATIKEYFELCARADEDYVEYRGAVKVCLPQVNYKAGWAPEITKLLLRHHMPEYVAGSPDKFSGLCYQICDGRTTAAEAARQFCPRTKTYHPIIPSSKSPRRVR